MQSASVEQRDLSFYGEVYTVVELEHVRELLMTMKLYTAAELLDAHLEQASHEQQTPIFIFWMLCYPRNRGKDAEKARKPA